VEPRSKKPAPQPDPQPDVVAEQVAALSQRVDALEVEVKELRQNIAANLGVRV
jgi:uncharacterized protein (UPF0335 family)